MRILDINIALYYYYLMAYPNNPNLKIVDELQVDQSSSSDSSVQKVKKLIKNLPKSEMEGVLTTILRLLTLTRNDCIIEAKKEGSTISENEFY